VRENAVKKNVAVNKMENTDEIVDFLYLYLQSRNVHNWNYVGYKNFKSLFTYITGIRDVNILRNIFEKMCKKGMFIKRKIASKTDYQFVYCLPK
jgi:hypothetical protein